MLLDTLLAQTPVPRDVPLPLPLDEFLLKALIVPAFLLHIVFVNLMVGGTILTSIYELLGRRRPGYDALAQRIAATVTVNKSLAVVLGVGPLLMISLAYTMQWYVANSMTGYQWLMLIPLITLAFLLTYLHKYTWERWNAGRMKVVHQVVGLGSVLLFAVVPLIFLANVNIMHFPNRWGEVSGFLSALLAGSGNAIGRYLHFLVASVGITAFFLCLWLTRNPAARDQLPDEFSAADVRRHFYRVAFFVLMAQFIIGPVLLLILPHVGISLVMVCIILVGAAVAAGMLMVLRSGFKATHSPIGQRWYVAAMLMFVVALAMGSGRQVYRQTALAEHQWQVEQRTRQFTDRSELAQTRDLSGSGSELTGAELFSMTCASCHQLDEAIAAPTIREIAGLYAGRPEDIVAWAKAPGKKRVEFAQMPAFSHLGDERLQRIAEHMLELGAAGANE